MSPNENADLGPNPKWVLGLWVAASIIALGVIASLVLRETGGSVVLALIAVVACNLIGALVMDLFSNRDGAVLGSMSLLMLLSMLPLLWVPDQTAWILQNPLTFGIVLILVGYLHSKIRQNWPLFAVAAVLGCTHILISLF